MASSSMEQFDSPAEELSVLKEKYGGKFRVIDNVGDFRYVVIVKRNLSDLAYKFQLYDGYPSVAPHIVIKSTQLLPDDQDRLTHYLSQFAKKNPKAFILKPLVEKADAWLKAQDLEYVLQEMETDKKESKKKIKKKKRPKQIEDEIVNEKKASMKTAEDVIKRIQWDDHLQAENFTVAYLDRFIGVVEKNFSSFTWEDLASVDYEDLAIPQHRIQYFKYKEEKVWDKNKRLDNVFGSTGSGVTIIDVIANYDEKHRNQEVAGVVAGNSLSESDSEDDDVVINTGFGNPEGPAAEEIGNEENDGVRTRARDAYWGAKSRPTHFLCLRVTSPEICENASKVHDIIRELEPDFEQSFIPPDRLHITIACLGLDNLERVNEATEFLYRVQPELQKLNPQKIKAELEDCDNFFHNVLYAKVKENQALMNFAQHVRSLIVEAGIEIRDVFDFTPHMTLLKFKKGVQIEMKTRTALDARIYGAVKGIKFGTQAVDNLYLCEMGENRDVNGFYICPALIDFFGNAEENESSSVW